MSASLPGAADRACRAFVAFRDRLRAPGAFTSANGTASVPNIVGCLEWKEVERAMAGLSKAIGGAEAT